MERGSGRTHKSRKHGAFFRFGSVIWTSVDRVFKGKELILIQEMKLMMSYFLTWLACYLYIVKLQNPKSSAGSYPVSQHSESAVRGRSLQPASRRRWRSEPLVVG